MTDRIPGKSNSSKPVTLINAFAVPPQDSERFLDRWRDNARIMSAQLGFIRATMHQALSDDVELRFVNVAEWESGAALDKARTVSEWRASMHRLVNDPHLRATAHPADYQVVIDIRPDRQERGESSDADIDMDHPELDRLAATRYVLLTTFRENGCAVSTPVWAARQGTELVVRTPVDTGKVKRIRHNPTMELAQCDIRGRVRGHSVRGRARLLDPVDTPAVHSAIERKYGVLARLLTLAIRFRPGLSGMAGIAIALSTTDSAGPGPP